MKCVSACHNSFFVQNLVQTKIINWFKLEAMKRIVICDNMEVFMNDDKLIRISDYCDVDHDKVVELGILDALVYYDSPLFINPKLISKSDVPELINSTEKIIDFYRDVIRLLKITNCDDAYWKVLKKMFDFLTII